MGVGVQASPQGTAPLIFAPRPKGQTLRPIHYALPVASAQVKSCLLLAALAASGPVTLSEPAASRDHTERMLRALGVQVASESDGSDQGGQVTLKPPSPLCLPPLSTELPGDFSSAAFLIVAALITPGSAIKLEGVGLNPTRTGLLAALRKMGADISVSHGVDRHGEPVGDIFARHSDLQGTKVSGPLVVSMIDEFPIFAVAAAFARGPSIVSQAAELRHKESDRIATACRELCKLGVEMAETADGFVITGGKPLRGGIVAAHGDHRLAMALAVAGLAANGPVSVEGAEIIAESFPDFSAILGSLGAEIVVESE
jgi:3-phosphoshikimate 1-carboxyvinyltransferase